MKIAITGATGQLDWLFQAFIKKTRQRGSNCGFSA